MTAMVTVYTSGPGCKACTLTKRHLEKRGIAFSEVPIDSDDNILAAADELGLRAAPIVCVTTWAGEKPVNDYWDGYRPDRIDAIVRAA